MSVSQMPIKLANNDEIKSEFDLISHSRMKSDTKFLFEELEHISNFSDSNHSLFLPAPHLLEDSCYSKQTPVLSIDEIEHYENEHVAMLATSANYLREKDHCAGGLLVQLASEHSWVTGITCFNELNININLTAVIRYMVVAKDCKKQGIGTSMLWKLEEELKQKRHYVVELNSEDTASIKTFFKAGYIIKYIDKKATNTTVIMYKRNSWSNNVNFYTRKLTYVEEMMSVEERKEKGILSADDLFDRMEEPGFAISLQKYFGNSELVDRDNTEGIKELILKGYFPTSLTSENKYVCDRITGLSESTNANGDIQKNVA